MHKLKGKFEAYVISTMEDNQRTSLLDNLAISVEKIEDEAKIYREGSAIRDSETVTDFCYSVFAILSHEMKEKSPSFWNVVKKLSPKDTIQMIYRLDIKQSDRTRCESWIRHTLNEGTISSYMQLLIEDNSLLKDFYKPSAFVRDSEKVDSAISLMTLTISSVHFQLNISNKKPEQVKSSKQAAHSYKPETFRRRRKAKGTKTNIVTFTDDSHTSDESQSLKSVAMDSVSVDTVSINNDCDSAGVDIYGFERKNCVESLEQPSKSVEVIVKESYVIQSNEDTSWQPVIYDSLIDIPKNSPTASQQISKSSPTSSQQISKGSPTSSQQISKGSPTSTQQIYKSSPTSTQQIYKSSPTSTQQIYKSSPTSSQQISKSSPTSSQQISKSSPTSIQQISKSSPISSQQISKGSPTSSQQISKSSPTFTQQISKSSLTSTQQISKSSPTSTQQISKSSPTSSQQISKGSPTSSQQISKSSPTTTQQISKNSPTTFQQISKNSPTTTQQTSKNSPTSIQQISKNSPTSTQQISKNSPINTQHISKNSPTASQTSKNFPTTQLREIAETLPLNKTMHKDAVSENDQEEGALEKKTSDNDHEDVNDGAYIGSSTKVEEVTCEENLSTEHNVDGVCSSYETLSNENEPGGKDGDRKIVILSNNSQDMPLLQVSEVSSTDVKNNKLMLSENSAFCKVVKNVVLGDKDDDETIIEGRREFFDEYYVPGIHTTEDIQTGSPHSKQFHGRSKSVVVPKLKQPSTPPVKRALHSLPTSTPKPMELKYNSFDGKLGVSDSESDTCSTSDQSFSILAELGINDDFIGLKENHFSTPEVFMGFSSKEELEHAILTCTRLIREASDNSQRKLDLVTQLIQLRLKRHELKEKTREHSPVGKKVLGHCLEQQTRSSARFECDVCGKMVWLLLQTSYMCKDCGFHCHRHCVSNIDRTCVNARKVTDVAIEMRICPESGLSSQNYRCADCYQRFPLREDAFACRLCDYTGQYYCHQCHWNETLVVPSRVVHNWDFTPQSVCRRSKHFLQLLMRKPNVHLESLNSSLFNFIEELQDVRTLRRQIMEMKRYITSCRIATEQRLLLIFQNRQHFVDDTTMYSLQDLIDVENNSLLDELTRKHAVLAKHIKLDCPLCQGKGFICEVCNSNEVIFPFDSHVINCTCRSAFHRMCYSKNDCPRCARNERRMSLTVKSTT